MKREQISLFHPFTAKTIGLGELDLFFSCSTSHKKALLKLQENGQDSHQEYYLDKWLWKDGKMLELKNREPINEVMYLHFINWKRTMTFSEVKYKDNPQQFYISYSGMHYEPHSNFAQIVNGVKNVYSGYYVILKRKAILKRVKILNKKIKNLFKV
ncbi:hypothetical protein Aeqsu_2235 [Aequorivita sublithincola DSM 14238]|uniref:Uncharacterized protein n=1 Tax=Aequorivita sublithincola (strain DSM 14238 / LMG 21431 / ACAM 643 / 9-3) TaxID=746697 RepID=I3YXH7_AEQSU|nr:hypothetical protein [Aequorivita sublithincola]AFL81695.1 hypothetical protein Aeqsu_2235 [Aequorivita sublithincola DSM 14238]